MAEEQDAGALSPTQWRRARDELSGGRPLDVLVVGGGVVGAGAALDSATRGLRTGIVEAQDWASGSSSRSSKLAHGGLRYLRMLDISLVREALAERSRLLANASHLVRPAQFLYPIRHRGWEKPYVRGGVGAYDLLARWSGGALGRHELLGRREVLRLAPALRPRSLRGGVVYGDAQVDDARLVLALVRTAVANGAHALSRVEVTGPLRADDPAGPGGVRVRLAETGETAEIRARVVVLAAGAWNDEVERRLGVGSPVHLAPSKGVHLVVPREAIPSSVALIVPTRRSVLFVLPWGESWIVGTTDTPWPFARARPVATGPDLDYLLARASAVLARPLGRDDVVSVYAGVRPLLGDAGRETTRLSREHAVTRPLRGVVTVSGGKLTTYRPMAAEAVDAAVEAGGLALSRSRTAELGLLGSAGSVPFAAAEAASAGFALDPVTARRLSERHGALLGELVDQLSASPGLAREVAAASGLLRGEVVHAVTHEGARHVEDVLLRRSRVALETSDRGAHAANEVAALMAGLLGWEAATVRAEVEAYRAAIGGELAAERAETDEAAAAVAGSDRSYLPLP